MILIILLNTLTKSINKQSINNKLQRKTMFTNNKQINHNIFYNNKYSILMNLMTFRFNCLYRQISIKSINIK